MRKLLVVLALTFGCGDDGGAVDAPRACRDLGTAFADLCARCCTRDGRPCDGPERAETYRQCYRIAALNVEDVSCDNARSVRDVQDLYARCIPGLRDLGCDLAGWPPACDDQIR